MLYTRGCWRNTSWVAVVVGFHSYNHPHWILSSNIKRLTSSSIANVKLLQPIRAKRVTKKLLFHQFSSKHRNHFLQSPLTALQCYIESRTIDSHFHKYVQLLTHVSSKCVRGKLHNICRNTTSPVYLYARLLVLQVMSNEPHRSNFMAVNVVSRMLAFDDGLMVMYVELSKWKRTKEVDRDVTWRYILFWPSSLL